MAKVKVKKIGIENIRYVAEFLLAKMKGNSGGGGTSAQWFTGTAVTGTSTSSASVSGSNIGDMYLNTTTGNVYQKTSATEWTFVCGIKGADGRSAFTQGTGISITSEGVINHSNKVTAATKGATTTTAAGSNAGAVTVVGGVKYDAQGHITDVYTRTITLSDTTYNLSGYAKTTDLAAYLPLSGGSVTGDLAVNGILRVGKSSAIKSLYFTENTTGSFSIIVDSTNELNTMYFNTYTGTSSRFVWRFYSVTGFAEMASLDRNGAFTAKKLKVDGGTSSQFLKADGSVDTNSYLTNAQAASMITMEDLSDVLTASQISKLEAKVSKRVALAQKMEAERLEADAKRLAEEQAEFERIEAEAKAEMEAMEKAEMESAQAGEIGSGEISKPSKPSVEGNESI